MDFNILQQFRQQLYGCFEQSRDALFNLADALLSETQAHSVIELSLSPHFQRKWPSLYAALQLGKLNQARFEQTLVNFAPKPTPGQRLVLAVDASNIEGPFSDTSRDRGYLYVHNLPEWDTPVTVGWQFSTVVVLPPQPRLREPGHFELWTALVSMVHDELNVAESLGLVVLRPWESRQRALSPQQIRRGLGAIMDELGSPARPSQSRGKGTGRALEVKIEPAMRYKVVKKTLKKVKLA